VPCCHGSTTAAGELIIGSVVIMQALKVYKSHEGPVAAAAWRPGSLYHFVTASYDGSVRAWDARSAVPLAILEDASERIFAIACGAAASDGSMTIAAGGEDATLRLYAAPAVGERGSVDQTEG
jgi:WD40 repeat protein